MNHQSIAGFITILLMILLLSQSAESQPVRVHTSMDSLAAGQIFDLYVIFDNPGNFDRVMLPDSTAFADPFEFRSRSRGLTRAGSDSVRIRLQFFGTKDTLLTGLTARGISGQDTTLFDIPDYPVYFVSLLGEDAEMKPLKPIFGFPGSIWCWILLILFLALIAAGLFYYLKKFRQEPEPIPEPKPVVIPPFIHPGKQLEDGIDALERDLNHNNIPYESFYIRAGDLIREYYEETHHFPALEQTTREVINEIRHLTTSQKFINMIRDILNECDMVKFARFIPGENQMAEMIIKLRSFANEALKHDDRIFLSLRAEYNKMVIEMQREDDL